MPNPARVPALLGAAVLTGAVLLFGGLPAHAEAEPEGTPPGDILDPFADVVLQSFTLRTETTGALTPVQTPPPPYPAGAGGGTSHTAALIELANPDDPAQSAFAYCIDLRTGTNVGVGYVSGDWTEANVPNLEYVAYILHHYFPAVAWDSPDNPLNALSTVNQVAAVQTAIWYFSDGYVLAAGYNPVIRDATASVVADALANAAGGPPFAPELTIVPDFAELPETGELAGPFTITSNVEEELTVETIEGLVVALDPEGIQQVLEGDTLPPDAEVWIGADGPATERFFGLVHQYELEAGSVYLYDQADPNRSSAQKLVLAQRQVMPIRAGATFGTYPAGEILVRKHIEGTGAGLQGVITIDVECSPAPAYGVPTSFTIPAGAAAGVHEIVIGGLLIGSECTITESATGANPDAVLQSSTIVPGTVTVSDEPQTAEVTNTYTRPLPATGPDAGPAALAAGLALLLGGVLAGTVRVTRR